jgi:HK97 family phage major capsid protein
VNATLKSKHEELETLRIRTRKILDEHKTHLPPEEIQALDLIRTRADALRTEIADETKLEAAQRDLADLDRYLDDPVRKIPHGSNGTDGERTRMARAGWEVKAGIIHKHTSLGTLVPMYPEDVVYGDIPDEVKRDPESYNFYQTTRASMADEYKSAYTRMLKMTMRYGSSALSMLSGPEQKALSEGTDTAGGFIVPPDIQAEVLARVPQTAVMRRYARVQPTNRDILRWPAVAPNAGTYSGIPGGSILSSGFVGSWAGETPAFTDTDLSWQAYDIPIKKVRVATKLSNDFVNDAAVNVLAFLAQNGGQNMALVEDLGFIQGLGTGLQPLGMLNVPGIPTTNVAGTTAHTISNTTSATGSVPLITTLAFSLPAQYAGGARWLMRRTIEGSIRNLVDGQGRPIWQAWATAGIEGDNPTQLLGMPVVHSDWMPADGVTNNMPLIVGDLSHYIIGQRTQITSVILRERFADSDQLGIILFERVGGGAYNQDAFRGGIV